MILGKQPRAIACFMQEKVADIIAWLAIIAASVAITNTGQNRTSALQIKQKYLNEGTSNG